MFFKKSNPHKKEDLAILAEAMSTYRVQKAKFQQKMRLAKPRDEGNKSPKAEVFFRWIEREGKERYGNSAEWLAVYNAFNAFMAGLAEFDKLMSRGDVEFALDISESVVMRSGEEFYQNTEKLYEYISKLS